MSGLAIAPGSEVIWQDVECGGYAADLPTWERLAAATTGELADLGAGNGRVALHLAARGHRVVAIDSDEDLLAALRERARARGLTVETVEGDVRLLALGRRLDLILAPMQLIHLLDGPQGRAELLRAVGDHLTPGGRFCAALLDDSLPLSSGTPEPLPDLREVDDWIHSSLPVDVRAGGARIAIDRRRQLVSPAGELSEESVTIHLDAVAPDVFEREAAAAGFRPLPRLPIAETADHVGSVVVCLEAI